MAFPYEWNSGALPDIVGMGVGPSTKEAGIGDGATIGFEQQPGSPSAVRWDLDSEGTVTSLAARAYILTPATWPSSAFNFIAFMNASFGNVAVLTVSGAGQPGQIRLVTTGGSNVSVAPSNTISTSTWYRVELQYDASATRARVAVFDMGSDVALWTSDWQVNPNFSAPIRYVTLGAVAASPTVAEFHADAIKIDSATTAWTGRHAADTLVPVDPEDPEEPSAIFPVEWSSGALPPVLGDTITVVPGGLGPDNEAIQIVDASGAATMLNWDLGSDVEPRLSMRAYVKTPAAWSATAFNLLSIWETPSVMRAALVLSGSGQPGQIRLGTTSGVTLATAPNNTIEVDTWYRVELQYRSASGEARVGVFGLGSNTPMWTSDWISHVNFESTVRLFRIGNPANNPQVPTFLVDDIAVERGSVPSWIGRVAHDEAPESGGQGSVYLGRGTASNLGQTPNAQGQTSGIAHSNLHDVVWSITDTGGGSKNEVYALSTTDASVEATITLPGLLALDIESICYSHYDGRLYIADIGNSTGARTTNGTLAIAVIEEPTSLVDATITPTIHSITYGDSANRDAEALAIHPTDGRLFIVNKDDGRLWWAPSLHPTSVTVFNLYDPDLVLGERVSEMDFSPDGYYAIVTEGNDDEFRLYRTSDWTLVDTWQHTLPGNLEAACWARDGSGLFYANDTQNNSLGSTLYFLPVYRESDPDEDDPGTGGPDGPTIEVQSSIPPMSAVLQGIPLPTMSDWDPAKTYRRRAIVNHEGRAYECAAAHVNKVPGPLSAYWREVGVEGSADHTFSGYARTSSGTVQVQPRVQFFDSHGTPVGKVEATGPAESTHVPVVDTFGEDGESLGGRTPTRASAGLTWSADAGTCVISGGAVGPGVSDGGYSVATVAAPSADRSVSVTWGDSPENRRPSLLLRWTDATNWVRITANSIQQCDAGVFQTVAPLSSAVLPGDRVSALIDDGVVGVFRSRAGGNYVLIGMATVTAASGSNRCGVMWSDS